MFNDPQAFRRMIREQAFATENLLLLRKQTHDLYSTPPLELPDWVLSRFDWTGNEFVLDIGSGPGTYYDELMTRISPDNYVAGDLSYGMVKALRERVGHELVGVMDAEHLPFPDEVFDVVLANHVLYYVPNVESAVAEIRRVLRRPKGVLIAATSSEYTMPEFTTLMQRAVRLLRRSPSDELADLSITQHFSLENGPLILARHFDAVARYDIPNAFVFREARPVVDYIESCRAFYEPMLPLDIRWDEFMTMMADQVRRLVDHFGELVVNKLTGVILATDAGGFAEEYQRHLNNSRKR